MADLVRIHDWLKGMIEIEQITGVEVMNYMDTMRFVAKRLRPDEIAEFNMRGRTPVDALKPPAELDGAVSNRPLPTEHDRYTACLLLHGAGCISDVKELMKWVQDVDQWWINNVYAGSTTHFKEGTMLGWHVRMLAYRFRRRFINWCGGADYEG